jgi:hypothetical protein
MTDPARTHIAPVLSASLALATAACAGPHRAHQAYFMPAPGGGERVVVVNTVQVDSLSGWGTAYDLVTLDGATGQTLLRRRLSHRTSTDCTPGPGATLWCQDSDRGITLYDTGTGEPVLTRAQIVARTPELTGASFGSAVVDPATRRLVVESRDGYFWTVDPAAPSQRVGIQRPRDGVLFSLFTTLYCQVPSSSRGYSTLASCSSAHLGADDYELDGDRRRELVRHARGARGAGQRLDASFLGGQILVGAGEQAPDLGGPPGFLLLESTAEVNAPQWLRRIGLDARPLWALPTLTNSVVAAQLQSGRLELVTEREALVVSLADGALRWRTLL